MKYSQLIEERELYLLSHCNYQVLLSEILDRGDLEDSLPRTIF